VSFGDELVASQLADTDTTSPSTGTELRWLNAVNRAYAARPLLTMSISFGITLASTM